MPYNIEFFGKGHSFARGVNDLGAATIARWETVQLTPYFDAHKSGPRLAIGLGHTDGSDIEPKVITPGMTITYEQAMDIFKLDLGERAKFVDDRVKVPINTFMFQALVSLVFNCGRRNVEEGRVLTLLNEEKYVGAGAAFIDHRYAWEPVVDPATGDKVLDSEGKEVMQRVEKNGLILRRGCEMNLWATKVE